MLMLLNLKEAATKETTIQLRGNVGLNELQRSRRDVVNIGSAEAELEAVPAGDAVVVHGTISFDVEQRCSRCLEPVKQHLDIPFQESFTMSATAAEQDEDLILVEEEKIELVPYLEEAVQLGIPYIPLCDTSCQGLCPVCGTNRNVKPCECKQEKIDPRLAGLADFFNSSDR
jgi:uncharacterized protein